MLWQPVPMFSCQAASGRLGKEPVRFRFISGFRVQGQGPSGLGEGVLSRAEVGFSKMRGLSFDGRCKTFDARADGFARGEGLGSVFIRASESAESNLVGLGGVAINHDGRAATITAPNGTAQQRVLRAALADRGTQGEDVTCLECHGTGTALGDPIEVGAQRAVYGKGRTESQPLILAATKSNIGHTEGHAKGSVLAS